MMRICDQLDHKNIQKLCGLVTDPAGDNLIFMSTVGHAELRSKSRC
jgi:hypothetical protein